MVKSCTFPCQRIYFHPGTVGRTLFHLKHVKPVGGLPFSHCVVTFLCVPGLRLSVCLPTLAGDGNRNRLTRSTGAWSCAEATPPRVLPPLQQHCVPEDGSLRLSPPADQPISTSAAHCPSFPQVLLPRMQRVNISISCPLSLSCRAFS